MRIKTGFNKEGLCKHSTFRQIYEYHETPLTYLSGPKVIIIDVETGITIVRYEMKYFHNNYYWAKQVLERLLRSIGYTFSYYSNMDTGIKKYLFERDT